MAPNHPRFTLNELRYVVALAEEGHFGRAAARCHVSQPTLSAQLKKLERGLGVRLFERTNRRVAATPAGEEIVAQARRVLEEADKIGELAGRHEGPLCGPLRLGLIPTVGPYLLPPLVPALHEGFPRLQLVLREDLTANLTQRLKKHGLDAVLCALPVAEPGLVYEPLFDEPFWVIMPPRHPLAGKAEIAESDLAGEHLLLLDEGHCLRDQALAVCGRDPGGAEGDDFRAASLETVREMVGAGLGLSLLPALAVGNRAPAKLKLEARPFGSPSPKRRIGLVWRRGYPRADGLMMLADVIRRHLPEGVKPVARRAAA
jgi:LysR family hydrogen peroxide-inducible transcriptional activator